MLKKILQLIVVLLFTATGVMAQTVQIEDASRAPGDILVQVDMLNYTDVAAITLSVDFDSDLMDFTGIEDTQLTGTWLANYNAGLDKIVITYTADGLSGYPITGKLLDLKFRYKGGFSSPLVFDEASCEINTSTLANVPSTYTDGSVSQSSADGTVSMADLIDQTIGNTLLMPVTIAGTTGFDAVDAITLKVGYDPAQVTFAGVVENAITGVSANAANGVLTIIWSGAATDLTSATLLDIKFVYYGGVADIDFVPGCEISSGLTLLPTSYDDGSFTPKTETASLTISDVGSTSGNSVSVPIVAAGFGASNLGAITLYVSYDNALTFTGYTAQQLTGWGPVNASGGVISIVWTGAGGPTIADGNLLTLNFNYGGGLAEIAFEPGSEVKSVNAVTIPVSFNNGSVDASYTVSGVLKYANPTGDVRPITNSTVYLLYADGITMVSTTTDGSGNYSFTDVLAGDYTLGASTTKAWCGTAFVDIDDAIDIFDFWLSGVPAFNGIFLEAGDVNMDSNVDIDDAIDVFDRWLSNVKPITWTAPDWVFESHAITVSNVNVIQNINGLCSGDVDASYNPIP